MPPRTGRSARDPSPRPERSILKIPKTEAEAKLTDRIRVGRELASTPIPSIDGPQAAFYAGAGLGMGYPGASLGAARPPELRALERRAEQWRDYNRTWLDANLGGEAAEEYKTASTHMHFGGSDNPATDLRFLREDIESEVSKLESIHDRLDLWLPPGHVATSSGLSLPAPANPTAPAADSNGGTAPRINGSEAITHAVNRKAVMVIYGHDTEAKDTLFDWLRAIGLQPGEWNKLVHAGGSGSPYIGQILDQAFRDAQAVIAFFTPDERVISRTATPAEPGAWRLQARPNVLLEAGMALATHPDRTILVTLGDQELPSDLAGRHYVRLNPTSAEPLHDLEGRLRKAGCDTNTSGSDWLKPARFPDRSRITPTPA